MEYVNIKTDAVDKNVPTKETFDAFKAAAKKVTLSSSGWSSNTQTVTVNGVLADESAQEIMVMPAMSDMTAYHEAGVRATAQAANSLTFTCNTVPATNVSVYIIIKKVIQNTL